MINFRKLQENNTEWVINLMLKDIELTKEQIDTVISCLMSPTGKMIIADEMGLGKTYTCMGLIQMARLLHPGKKILISTPKSVLKNFENLIKKSTGASVLVSSGRQDDIKSLEKHYKDYDIILVQHSFWINAEKSLLFIYNHVDDFSFTFFDEADFKNAIGFDMFLEFMRLLPMGCVANATPIENNAELIYNLLYGCGATDLKYNRFKNKYSKDIWQNDIFKGIKVFTNKIYNDFKDYITVKNRADIGLSTEVNIDFIKLNPSSEQLSWMESGMTKNLALYSPNTYKNKDELMTPVEVNLRTMPSLKALTDIIIKCNNKLIIYVKNTKAIREVYNLVKSLGKNPYIIDGKYTKTDSMVKNEENKFNEDDNGIMITNIIKGINLQTALELVVYNNPSDLQQLIYRMIRGFISKEVKIHWIYYKNYEEDSISNILSKTKNVSNLLGRELDIIEQLEKELNPKFKVDAGPVWYNKWLNEKIN